MRAKMSHSDKKGDDFRKNCPDKVKDDDLDDMGKSQVLDSEQLFQG